MTYRRHRPGAESDSVSDSVSDLDDSMRQAIQHESIEALRHQLEVEKTSRASVQRSDYLFSLGTVAFFGGLGFAVGALPRPKIFKRRRR